MLIILIIAIIIVSLLFLYVKGKLNKINYVEIDKNNLSIEKNTDDSLDDYRNIALFGLDNRVQYENQTYEPGQSKTDCIMIASINTKTNDVKIVSVYRDTYMQIEGHGLDNINTAYFYGGPQLAVSTLNKNLDLNIKEFVTVNFTALAKFIDDVGGIELDITPEELKYINGYLKDLRNSSGIPSTNVTTSGIQTVSGAQAVAYSRIRYTYGADHKRTERMRTVLIKAFEKLKGKNVTELNKIADDILPHIYTNIRTNEIFEMIPEISKYNVVKNEGWPYKVDGKTIDELWRGVPHSLESNVQQLHEELFEGIEYTLSDAVKRIDAEIKEVSGYEE